jgi:hypothetical protein
MRPNQALCSCALALAAVFTPGAASADPSKEQCIAANDAAQDLRQAGKLREAREKLALCVAQSCPGPVREDCAQRLDEVNRAMPTLVFEVKDKTGNDVGAATVTMDGRPLADGLGGASIAIDPGEHRFVFEDPYGIAPKTETRIIVREGDKDRHVRVVLGAPAKNDDAEHDASTPSDGGTQRTIGLVLGGVGAVSLVVGTVFAFVSKSTYDGAQGCPNACTDSGYQQGQSAYSQATVATVGLAAGVALAAAGGVLYFTAPKAGVSVSPTVGASGAGLRIVGAW